jgi:hypothetical protein
MRNKDDKFDELIVQDDDPASLVAQINSAVGATF